MKAGPALIAAALAACGARAEAFDDVVRGATVSAGIATTPVGDALMGELGGAWGGMRVRDRRWVLQWELLLAARAGWLGNQHPFSFLAGVHASSWVEAGYRFRSAARFSPYLGLRLAGDAQSLAAPDAPSLESVNAVDGVGGNVARGALRVAFGASYFDEARSVLLTPFVQEELDAPELHTPGASFTELGLALRYDVQRSLVASLEGFCGVTPERHTLVGTSDTTMRCGLDGALRKIFANGMWIGATLALRHDTDDVGYAGGASYETGDAPWFSFAISYGVPLWRSR